MQDGPSSDHRFISLSLFFSTSPSHPSYILTVISPLSLPVMMLLFKTSTFIHSPLPLPQTLLPTDGLTMWAAGEIHFNSAEFLLQSTFASSRPSTYQALLLMGYHEIGIGAMTLAQTFIGTAIRMAQDLHRNADDWKCPAQDRGLSLSLPPRNSKSDVGLSLAMSSWSRSSLRVCTTKLTKSDSDILSQRVSAEQSFGVSAFLCGIMHVTSSTSFSFFSQSVFVNYCLVLAHPLARIRLGQRVEALTAIWPSAERAHRSCYYYHWSTLGR